MGTSHTYKCDNCAYSVETSGEVSYGMHYVFSPFKCNDCKIITDVIVGLFGEIYFEEQFKDPVANMIPDFVLEEKDKFYCCEKCNGKNIASWDSALRNCPKCNGRLNIDPSMPSVNWD